MSLIDFVRLKTIAGTRLFKMIIKTVVSVGFQLTAYNTQSAGVGITACELYTLSVMSEMKSKTSIDCFNKLYRFFGRILFTLKFF